MAMSPLARDIVRALIFKICALVALYALFFGPAHRIRVTAAEMTTLFSDAPIVARK